MTARLTLDERAELERLRRLTEEQAELIKAWESYGFDNTNRAGKSAISGLFLSKSAVHILAKLASCAGEVVTHEQLLLASEPGWMDASQAPDQDIVKVHIHQIRKALRENGYGDPISSRYRVGYSITREAAQKLSSTPIPEADRELLTAAKLISEKHAMGKLQPAHIDELRRAISTVTGRESLRALSGEVAAA